MYLLVEKQNKWIITLAQTKSFYESKGWNAIATGGKVLMQELKVLHRGLKT